MSRSGDLWNNSAMESFFSSLKTERVNRRVYAPRDQARADVFDYVERFYNRRRQHSTLGYRESGCIGRCQRPQLRSVSGIGRQTQWPVDDATVLGPSKPSKTSLMPPNDKDQPRREEQSAETDVGWIRWLGGARISVSH